MRRRWRIGWLGLGLVLALWLATACDRAALSPAPLPPAADCRPIEHALGTACVPDSPQRVVTLDSVTFENVLALGIEPIATASSDLASPHLRAAANRVEHVGVNGEPNLEKVMALQPDLILGIDFHTAIYRQATQIAPTVLTPFIHSGDWKNIFLQTSEAIGASAQAERVLAAYQQRLETFKAQLKGRAIEVSIVCLYPNSVTVYTTAGFNGTILRDAGLARPALQDLDVEETLRKDAQSPIQYAISGELLEAADGDVIFVIVNHGDPDVSKTRDRLQADPLWSRLRAVQQGSVYEVADYWVGSGPIAANRVLDDLFKYLIVPESRS